MITTGIFPPIDYMEITKNFVEEIMNQPGFHFSSNLPWNVITDTTSLTIIYQVYEGDVFESMEDLRDEVDRKMALHLHEINVDEVKVPPEVTLVFRSNEPRERVL